MSDAMIQKGTALMVSFGSGSGGAFVYTGYVPEDGLTWKKPAGNVKPITDENGATLTKIIQDPRDEFKMSLMIKASGGTVVPPIVGAAITITNPAAVSITCMVTDAEMSFSRTETKLSLSLIKESSMTYS